MWSGYSLCLLLAAIAAVSSQESSGNDTNLYGGDIMLTPEQQATLEATSNPSDPFGPQDAVVRNQRSVWPNGEVFYVIDSNLNSQAVTAIQAAMATYESRSCITFTERTNQNDYVRFFSGGGCFSFIGRVGGPQDISIGRGCEFEGIVIHEIFHALGRWHEQSRPDRDQFVRINTQNIQTGRGNNFDITSTSFVTTQGIPYDLRSVMHYSARAFSSNGQFTIEPIDPNVQPSELGQRQGLTDLDLQHVLTLYCGGGSAGTWSSWSGYSACSRTCNGGTQTRTRTCQGGTNCEGSNTQTIQCNTRSCPEPSSWGAWSTWSGCSASCGGGRQQRTRSCVGGNTCVGTMNQFRTCGTAECPEPPTWGSWGSWSSCSSTCQGGIRQRRRMCRNGNNCAGSDLEDENCNMNIPCTTPTNPNSGEWTSWSACSAQCGGGIRFRTRQCGSSRCTTQQESCNTQDCEPEPFLRGIRYRGCWYLNTRTGRLGTLEGRSPDLSDDPFTRTEPVSKCGIQAQKETYNYFGITLGYCISGSNLLSDYQYYPSQLCRDGRGAYNRGYFVMDVYEITNQQSFADSAVAGIIQGGTEETTTDDLNGSPGLTHSLVALLISTLIGLFCIFH